MTLPGIFKDSQKRIRIWRKDIRNGSISKVYVYFSEIDKIIPLDSSYEISHTVLLQSSPIEYASFDSKMQSKFASEFLGHTKFWQSKPVNKKEDVKMSEAPTTSKKEVRAGLTADIKNYKSQRKTLSDANETLKKGVQSASTRDEKRTLNDQIKANVQKRKELSDLIKTTVTKIKEVRKA